jgi:dienelactone hydrolase
MPRKTFILFAVAVLAAVAWSGGGANAELRFRSESDEIERTWQGGYIFYPTGGRFKWGPISTTLDKAKAALGGRRYPTIVYMHGCSGIDIASTKTARDFLLKGGFVVVMPNSYARVDKPASCILSQHLGGLHRSVLAWRQDEARNAIHMARRLPFVDPNNIFMVGLSEGAITTATTTGNEPINARVVEGWTCHAGWPEYWGLPAPASEPVLTLSTVDDPWFQIAVLKGNCGVFMKYHNGSKAIIFPATHPLHDQHFQLWHPDAMKAALDFMHRHMR